MINKETIAEFKSKKLIGTRNEDSDYFLDGKKRYGINIENECGDVLDYEYFDSEQEALDVINEFKTKVIFKKFMDEVVAIFPNNPYNEQLYGKTIVDSYMHIGQHSACSIELIDELEDASEEQYKDLKNELETIGYKLKN